MKDKPKILIVGGGHVGISAMILDKLHNELGEDLIIISPEDAIKQGLKPENEFEREPFIIKSLPKIEPITYASKPMVDNKKWYSKFENKRKKKRK